jgi:rhamnosyl/mannosyltransferase
MPNLSAFACLFSSKARAIPWVIHWHSDVLGAVPDWRIKLAYKGYKIFESILLKKSAAVIATSPNYLNNSTPLSCFKEKSYTVPLGIANKPLDVALKQCTTKKEASLSLLIIGRLTYYKGHKYLLEAMSHLENVELVIIGVGELESNLNKLVVKLNLSNRVSFLGNVGAQELNQSIFDCDLLCLPSIEKTEAFGLVLLEAARLAKPALVTSVQGSGMSWVVDDQITGIVVEPNSSDSLLKALQFSVKNKSILTRFGKAAKNKFDTEFDIEKSAGKVLDIYKKSLLKF